MGGFILYHETTARRGFFFNHEPRKPRERPLTRGSLNHEPRERPLTRGILTTNHANHTNISLTRERLRLGGRNDVGDAQGRPVMM